MGSPGQVFANNFMQGFGLMDAYYARKDNKQRSARAETRAIESHGLNMESAKTSNKLNKMKVDDLQSARNASDISSIFNDDKGGLIDFKSLTPDQINMKAQQFVNYANGDPNFIKDLTNGAPNVKGLSKLNFTKDKETGEVYIQSDLLMADGSVRPLTMNRSDDPNDKVKLIRLKDAYKMVSDRYGEQMGTRISPKEAAAMKRRSDSSATAHTRAKEIANIKAGNTGGSGRNSKSITTLKKNVRSLNAKSLGTAGLNGMSFQDNKAEIMAGANVYGEHLINNGHEPNAGEISAKSLQVVSGIYSNGGEVKFMTGKDGGWFMSTGQKDDSGKPIVQRLFSDQKPPGNSKPSEKEKPVNNQQDTATEKQGKPTAKKAPTWSEFLPAAKKANKGMSNKQIRENYNKLYRGDKIKPKTEKAKDNSGGDGLSDAANEKQAEPKTDDEELSVIGLDSAKKGSNPHGRASRSRNIKSQETANKSLQKVRSSLNTDSTGAGLSELSNDELAQALDSPHTTEDEKKKIKRYSKGAINQMARKITSMVK